MPEPCTDPVELLRRAAGAIELHGLAKGQWLDRNGCMCLYGALWWAATGAARVGVPTLAFHRAEAAVLAALPPDYTCKPLLWNDDPLTTGEQVVELLRRAASTLEVEHG